MKRLTDRKLRIASPFASLLLLLVPPLRGQPPPPKAGEEPALEQRAPFLESVEVNVVNVEVHVTDKNGFPVKNLTAVDFELFEDGRPVEISNFYAVSDGEHTSLRSAVESEAGGPRRGASTALPEALSASTVPEEQRLSLIIYFDNVFLRPFNRNKVAGEVRKILLDLIGPGDRAMLVTHERTLNVRQPFTTDMRAISEATYEIEKLASLAVQSQSERRLVIQRIEQSRSLQQAMSHASSFAAAVYDDLVRSIGNLKELVGSLAGLPGRKALLYVSDGIPMTAGEDLFYLADLQFQGGTLGQLQAKSYSARREFRELNARANANRVTFYTLDAAGLRPHGSLSAEQGGSTGGAQAGTSRLEADYARLANQQAPLLAMATDTGGLAAINTNNIDGALARMGSDFDSYYSLGYQTSQGGDGRYHDIEVKVKGRGYKVRHRNGYRSRTVESQIGDGTMAALLYGSGGNELEVEVRVAAGNPDDSGQYRVPVEVRIPLGGVTLLPQEIVHHGRLRVAVAAADAEGEVSPVRQTSVPLSIPNADVEQARGQYFVYEVELVMHRGRQKIAVGVRDEYSSVTSYVERYVEIGS